MMTQFTTADKLSRNFINAKTDQQKQTASDQYNKVYEKTQGKETTGRKNANIKFSMLFLVSLFLSLRFSRMGVSL